MKDRVSFLLTASAAKITAAVASPWWKSRTSAEQNYYLKHTPGSKLQHGQYRKQTRPVAKPHAIKPAKPKPMAKPAKPKSVLKPSPAKKPARK